MSKRYGYLIDQITDYGNMSEAFDEVVGGLRNKERKAYYEAKRSRVIADLQALIVAGRFRVESYTEFEVKEGPKIRKVQSPSVKDRIGCNAIMRVVEKYVYPMVIRTSAASIKGRGMHRLYRKVRTDIRHDREGTRFFYKCDIKKFYQSIVQSIMWQTILEYIKDPILLKILKGFVEMMPTGLSIGLRSSQCFGNLLLARIDHLMKEVYHVRYYYRYCDDIVMLAGSKKELWRLRDILHTEVDKLELRIKPDECIKPITEGLDFLGYVDNGNRTRLRKRNKVKAARKLARVKSRRRRKELIGSLKGMAKWGDCRNLFYVLTGKRMDVDFGSLGLQYVAEDGKKRFDGKCVSLRSLSNLRIKLLDFEEDVKTENGLRWLVSYQLEDGTKGKYFTDDKEQKYHLKQIQKMGKMGSVWTTIKPEPFGNGKVRYKFT
jgi:RNA-directed DNA polymerase